MTNDFIGIENLIIISDRSIPMKTVTVLDLGNISNDLNFERQNSYVHIELRFWSFI